jgi:hypothetical protein
VPAEKVSHKVDYLGGALLAVATTALILLATWGGTQYAWASADHRPGPSHRGGRGRVLRRRDEGRRADAPAACLPQPELLPLDGLAFLTGLVMFGAMTFLPLYQQTVQGASPTVSGLLLAPMMVGSAIASMLAG